MPELARTAASTVASTVVDDGSRPAVAPRTRRPAGIVPADGPRSPVARRDVRVSPWRRSLIAFGLCFAALIAIYFETFLDLCEVWGKSGTYAHGFFIFPISAWLVWRDRARLALVAPKVQPLALLPLAACGLLWIVGRSAGVHPVLQLAFVAMFPCIVWGIFGNAVTGRILYPLGFLVFAVPFGDFLMPTLMDHTADFTVAALRLSGVPVYREGNFFSIPSGNWSVVEACSGLRYLIASLTLGVLFAYLNYRAAWRRAAFIVAALAVPIIANWLRAYMIVMLAHLSGNKLATGVDHIIYGWLFFGLVMMLLFWVGNFWRDDDAPEATASDAETAAAASVAAPSVRATALMAIALVVVAAPWPVLAGRIEAIADAVHPGDIAIDAIPGWRKADRTTTFVPHYERARTIQDSRFVSADGTVDLFVAYYSGQRDNGLMITYGNEVVVVGDKTWGAVASRATTVPLDGRSLDVDETQVRGVTFSGTERFLSWQWYWVNGRLTTNPYLAKAYNALDKLTGRGDDSAVIVVTTTMKDAVDPGAERRLAEFIAAAEPTIQARLAALRDEARR